MTLPTVPVSVWEQIPVIVIFALLLVGIAWLMVKVFSKAVADINSHYSAIIQANNEQWQKYFDARSESYQLINQQVLKQLEGLTNAVELLTDNFGRHDLMERQALDEMSGKRKLVRKSRNKQ